MSLAGSKVKRLVVIQSARPCIFQLVAMTPTCRSFRSVYTMAMNHTSIPIHRYSFSPQPLHVTDRPADENQNVGRTILTSRGCSPPFLNVPVVFRYHGQVALRAAVRGSLSCEEPASTKVIRVTASSGNEYRPDLRANTELDKVAVNGL